MSDLFESYSEVVEFAQAEGLRVACEGTRAFEKWKTGFHLEARCKCRRGIKNIVFEFLEIERVPVEFVLSEKSDRIITLLDQAGDRRRKRLRMPAKS